MEGEHITGFRRLWDWETGWIAADGKEGKNEARIYRWRMAALGLIPQLVSGIWEHRSDQIRSIDGDSRPRK
jgi:hypothetical protein